MSSRVTHYFSGNPCSFEEIKMYDILNEYLLVFFRKGSVQNQTKVQEVTSEDEAITPLEKNIFRFLSGTFEVERCVAFVTLDRQCAIKVGVNTDVPSQVLHFNVKG